MTTGAFHFGGLSWEAQAGIRTLWAAYDLGELYPYIPLERAAWMFFVLRAAEDDPAYFPKGKWATIQRIEQMLNEEAAGAIYGELPPAA